MGIASKFSTQAKHLPFNRRLHITPTLTTVIGGFVFITAALVLIVQAATSEKVVRNLGGSLINSGMHSLEQAFSAQIEAVEEASSFTTAALSTGSILLRRPQEVADYMFGALSAMEHVSFVIVADRNGNFIQVDRGRADGILVPQFVPKTDETHALAGLISSSRDKTAPFWSGPAFYPQRQHTYIAHVQPILSDGPDGSDYEGLVLMAMSMERLSEVTSDISTGLVQVFMINPQTYGLIAHPALSEVFNLLSPTSPLIELENVPDTFLQTLKSTETVDASGYGIRQGHEMRAGYDALGNKRFVVLQSPDLGPTGLPISIGFSRYVPKTLVRKLLREGRAYAPPEEREVAVMFTDIAGFTSASEGMTATETAAFVNHHLSLLGAEITKEGGTIDKYIGDSVMAFWGAPERLENPAEPAARAAIGMARAIRADNIARVARGEAPVRIRIGLHMGPLVVGDIGAPERVNYTVIGDTVNAASRLESLGKEIDGSSDVVILVSSEIAKRLGNTVEYRSIGQHQVKGRVEPLEVVRLID